MSSELGSNGRWKRTHGLEVIDLQWVLAYVFSGLRSTFTVRQTELLVSCGRTDKSGRTGFGCFFVKLRISGRTFRLQYAICYPFPWPITHFPLFWSSCLPMQRLNEYFCPLGPPAFNPSVRPIGLLVRSPVLFDCRAKRGERGAMMPTYDGLLASNLVATAVWREIVTAVNFQESKYVTKVTDAL